MTGWIVEKTSRSGWRQKWRRFRIVTTAVSVTLVSAPRSDGACGRGQPARTLAGPSRPARQRRSAAVPFSLGASPVSWRKTSSSVGRRRPMSLTPIPARRSSAAASSTRTRLSRGAGKVSRFGRSSSSGAPQPTRSERGLGLVTLPHVGQLDLEDLAADAVLELVAGPFRDHAAVVDHGDLVRELIRLLEVLRRQQDRRPVAAQVADDLPDLVATPRIETGRRLVEEEHARLREQAGREVEPPSHAARVRLRGSVGGVGELEALEQLRRAAAGLRAREPEQAPEHLEVLAAGQQLVDRGELTGQGEQLAHARRLGDDVVTEQLGPSRVRLEQRRQDADERRLARAVRAEQAEDHALRNLQVDAGERRRRPEPLDHAPDTDCGRPAAPRSVGLRLRQRGHAPGNDMGRRRRTGTSAAVRSGRARTTSWPAVRLLFSEPDRTSTPPWISSWSTAPTIAVAPTMRPTELCV